MKYYNPCTWSIQKKTKQPLFSLLSRQNKELQKAMPSLYSWSITWCNSAAVNGKFKTLGVYKLDPYQPPPSTVAFFGWGPNEGS